MKKVICAILIIISATLLCDCDNSSNNQISYLSEADQIQETISGYFLALKSHDINRIGKYVSDELRKKYEDTITQSVNTVDDCKIISIDVDNIKTVTSNKMQVPVNYMITFSDDYIPVGDRIIGENRIEELFILEKNNDVYVISGIKSLYC